MLAQIIRHAALYFANKYKEILKNFYIEHIIKKIKVDLLCLKFFVDYFIIEV